MKQNLENLGIRQPDPQRLCFERGEGRFEFLLPSFPLKGAQSRCVQALSPQIQRDSGDFYQIRLPYLLNTGDRLEILLHFREGSSFFRLRYSLSGESRFQGRDGRERIRYGTLFAEYDQYHDIQLSQFNRLEHSFAPIEFTYSKEDLDHSEKIGPIALLEKHGACCLMAYEHGAHAPDHYLAFLPEEDGLSLYSAKGNYYDGMAVRDYVSPWLELGFSTSIASLLRQYRRFFLEELGGSLESRKPYLFYNTWNYQERLKYFRNEPYLSEMNEARMHKEIEVAHELGLEVFVIDTGWYEKTGDWTPDPNRFPNGLSPILEHLQRYGMRLGLWMNPAAAAVESQVVKAHPEFMIELDGVRQDLGSIWETPQSVGLCLASDYADWLIEKMAAMYQEYGVTYFKWDAVGQYGCNAPGHRHGTEQTSPEVRTQVYSYRMGLEMTRIAAEVSRRCPGSIVDFDITEGNRYVGLGFLSAGKYFSVNNGPYYENFDIPSSVKHSPDTINVFFYPGAAHAQICRASARFDSLIPSSLFLTHQLPEGSPIARRNAAAALVLGGNGLWGDLCALTMEEIAFWKEFLESYKQVRQAVTLAYPMVAGRESSSPEIHDKLQEETGCGAVVFFTQAPGEFEYITRPLKTMPQTITGAHSYQKLSSNRIKLTVRLAQDDAAVVFFS